MKKIILLICLVFSLAFLSFGCGDPSDPSGSFLDHNAIDLSNTKSISYEDVVIHETTNDVGIQMGLLYIERNPESSKYFIYSPIEAKYVFEGEAENIKFINSIYYQPYFEVQIDEETYSLYDYKGTLILENIKCTGFYVSVTRELVSEKRGVKKYHYTETISYSYNNLATYKNYEFDGDVSNRQEVDNSLKVGDKLDYVSAGTLIPGLEGYRYSIDNKTNNYHVYNSRSELVGSFYVPTDAKKWICDGSLFYQYSSVLDESNKDYDYIYAGVKYKLTTKMIDLKTCKENNIKLNYVFSKTNGGYYKNSSGVLSYLGADVFFIEGEIRKESAQNVILGNNSTVEFIPSRAINYSRLYKIAKNIIVDENYGVVYKKGEVIFDFSNNLNNLHLYNVIENGQAMVVYDSKNRYGIIDANLKVIVPFEYEDIADVIYNDKLFAVDLDGNACLIDLKGNKTIVGTTENYSTVYQDGFIIKKSEEADSNGRYTFTITDFDGKAIYSVKAIADVYTPTIIYYTDEYDNDYVVIYHFALGNPSHLIIVSAKIN